MSNDAFLKTNLEYNFYVGGSGSIPTEFGLLGSLSDLYLGMWFVELDLVNFIMPIVRNSIFSFFS